MSVARPAARTAERNTVPFPTGPPVTLATRTIRGLYRGSFRWSATKSNTVSAGRAMVISPSMKVMTHLGVSAQPGREGLGALAQFGQERFVHGPLHDGGQSRHDGGKLGEVLARLLDCDPGERKGQVHLGQRGHDGGHGARPRRLIGALLCGHLTHLPSADVAGFGHAAQGANISATS